MLALDLSGLTNKPRIKKEIMESYQDLNHTAPETIKIPLGRKLLDILSFTYSEFQNGNDRGSFGPLAMREDNKNSNERGWQDQANCLGADPNLFFPEQGASTREAREICRGCVVRMDCLEYALANGEKFGIWGGLSERERRRLRRQRALTARQAATS